MSRTDTTELSLCGDCIYMDANGWDVDGTDGPLPEHVPMSRLEGWLIGPDESDHICEGHFSWSPCDGCGDPLGGSRYCYIGTKRDTVSQTGEGI